MSKTTRTARQDDPTGIQVRITRRVPGLTARQIRRAVRTALAGHAVRQLSIAVVDDETIAELHQRFMYDPTPTDVLTFDLADVDVPGQAGGQSIEGEIVLSADTAARQARALALPVVQECLRYAVHGTLHLLGHDDRTPAQRRTMRQLENRVLHQLEAGDTPARATSKSYARKALPAGTRTLRRRASRG